MKADEFEYWNQPPVFETFIRATTNERIDFAGGIIRKNADTYTMVKPLVEWSRLTELKSVVVGAKRLRSVQFVSSTIPNFVSRTTGDWSYYLDRSWLPNKDLQYYIRRSNREGLRVSDVTVDDGLTMLKTWSNWAKNRHHMVIVGHYAEMIKDMRFKKQGWWLNDKLVGVTGFLPVEGGCVITLVKHLGGIGWLAPGIWSQMLLELQSRYPIVWCGDTAGWFKEHTLGLSKFRLYRVNMKKELL